MFFFGKKKKKEEVIEEKPKKQEFDSNGIDDLIIYIKKLAGVDLEPKREVLKKRLIMFCESKDIYSFKNLLSSIKIDKNLLQDLINLVTVNETYFYRELSQLEEAVNFMKELNKSIRILCAPCASGEEVYSLGIMAVEAGLLPHKLEFIGVDINSKAINDSKEAKYSERSLHRLSPALKDKYFTKLDDGYRVRKERLPRMRFEVQNIFDDSFLKLGKFDIIFSRNMMIYFDENFKRKTVERFHELLESHGRFYAGHADLVPQTPLFDKKIKGRLNYYQKI